MNIETSLAYAETDRQLYERELRAWLPVRIFDVHVHLYSMDNFPSGFQLAPANFLRKFGEYRREHHLAAMRLLLPDQTVTFNSFGWPMAEARREAAAVYTGSTVRPGLDYGMAMVAPEDTPSALRSRLAANHLIGYKPYPDFVTGKPSAEITIDDMLPGPQMELADELGLVVTLHLPRRGRLADPVNQRQGVELCQRYPHAKIIFAHIGRAYYLSGVTGYLDGLAACANAYLDTAMINHDGVLEYAFRHFPRERILFGSDAPIALLRGKSVEINNQYAYVTPEPYAMGTALHDSGNVLRYTSFFYEQLRGIGQAARRLNLSAVELENFFFTNAARLFAGVPAIKP